MDDFEKWYQFCMVCKYAIRKADDAEYIYCTAPHMACIHRKEIEFEEMKEKGICGQQHVK